MWKLQYQASQVLKHIKTCTLSQDSKHESHAKKSEHSARHKKKPRLVPRGAWLFLLTAAFRRADVCLQAYLSLILGSSSNKIPRYDTMDRVYNLVHCSLQVQKQMNHPNMHGLERYDFEVYVSNTWHFNLHILESRNITAGLLSKP